MRHATGADVVPPLASTTQEEHSAPVNAKIFSILNGAKESLRQAMELARTSDNGGENPASPEKPLGPNDRIATEELVDASVDMVNLAMQKGQSSGEKRTNVHCVHL